MGILFQIVVDFNRLCFDLILLKGSLLNVFFVYKSTVL